MPPGSGVHTIYSPVHMKARSFRLTIPLGGKISSSSPHRVLRHATDHGTSQFFFFFLSGFFCDGGAKMKQKIGKKIGSPDCQSCAI